MQLSLDKSHSEDLETNIEVAMRFAVTIPVENTPVVIYITATQLSAYNSSMSQGKIKQVIQQVADTLQLVW